MDMLEFKGNWNQIRSRLKEKYANLTDDDLIYKEGNEDEFLGRLQAKTGHTREELIKDMKSK